MKKVFQTIKNFEQGNCTQACIASLLEVELDDIPNFMIGGPNNYHDNMNRWMDQCGLCLISFTIDDIRTLDDSYCIAKVLSPRSTDPDDPKYHSVVWYRGEIVHDPNDDYTDVKYETPTEFTLIFPNDPIHLKGLL